MIFKVLWLIHYSFHTAIVAYVLVFMIAPSYRKAFQEENVNEWTIDLTARAYISIVSLILLAKVLNWICLVHSFDNDRLHDDNSETIKIYVVVPVENVYFE